MRRPIIGLLALLAFALPSSAATYSTDLLLRVETGLVFVQANCKGSSHTGTGFLVGPRLMITARHVVQAAPGCVVSVRQLGSGATARGTDWTTWFSRVRADASRTDLSVVRLDHPLHGYAFPLTSVAPKVDDTVLALGYGYPEGLGTTQGQVADVVRKGGVPEIEVRLSGALGGSGGPILNAGGQVVGLVQRGGRRIESLELSAFLGTNDRGLCEGVARATPSTLCGTAPAGGGTSSSRVLKRESFTLRYPPGWRASNGSATTVFDPVHPLRRLTIGHSVPPAVTGLRHVTFAGYPAVRSEQNGAGLRKVEIAFTDDAGTDWRVTLEAPTADWAVAAPRLRAVAAAFRLTS
jgi:Trypsin-like peptidase domain